MLSLLNFLIYLYYTLQSESCLLYTSIYLEALEVALHLRGVEPLEGDIEVDVYKRQR